ncbi:hypothetical protein ACFVQB_03545 [Paenibacillus sp. NPDC057886]|uniref:hypothetical protein n=1 Tax=Paenibacillus sp. NPDC057886 TaxID=3346270 RepID=UPI0036948BC7
MKHALLDHQRKIKHEIFNKIKDSHNFFIIEGVSGTGKTYLRQDIINELFLTNDFEIFLMEGDKKCITREYYPIEQCLSSKQNIPKHQSEVFKSTVAKTAGAVPLFGKALESFVHELLNFNDNKFRNRNSHLTDTERNIIFRMRHISKKRFLIYAENFQWWDDKSIELFYQIMKENQNENSFLKNAVIIINWTDEQLENYQDLKNDISKQFGFVKHKLDVIKKDDYKNVLHSMGLKKGIKTDLLDGLYSITGGHLHLTKEMINYLNDSNDQSSVKLEELADTNQIATLIQDRLKNLGATGEVVEEVLKYASILGISFTFFELEKITNKNQEELQHIIKEANKLYFVEQANKKVNFIHEFIRSLFEKKLEDIKTYYYAYAECLKVIKPNDYIARARALLKASCIKEAASLYVLAYIQKLRNNDVIKTEFLEEIFISIKELEAEEYIELMQQAYTDYNNKEFDKAIEKLSWIEDTHPTLLRAERDYLLAMCLTKKIDRNHRQDSVSILENYKDLHTLEAESELWSRILSLLIISYIHINDKESAKKVEKDLMLYLHERVEYDLNAKDKINILRRKSSAVYSISIAQRNTHKSVKYFGPSEEGGVPLNPIQYYFALNNHVANTFVLGKFEESHKDANKLIDFITKHPEVEFPRTETALNNFVLSGIAAKKISLKEGLGIFIEIFKETKSSADRILLRINQSVLYAATNQLEESLIILTGLRNLLINKSNIELYYQYYIESNLMVVEYLLGNKLKAMKLWTSISYLPSIGDENYYRKRHEIIKDIFDSNLRISGEEWLTYIDRHHPDLIEHSKEKSFGNGFLVSDIQFWSES